MSTMHHSLTAGEWTSHLGIRIICVGCLPDAVIVLHHVGIRQLYVLKTT